MFSFRWTTSCVPTLSWNMCGSCLHSPVSCCMSSLHSEKFPNPVCCWSEFGFHLYFPGTARQTLGLINRRYYSVHCKASTLHSQTLRLRCIYSKEQVLKIGPVILLSNIFPKRSYEKCAHIPFVVTYHPILPSFHTTIITVCKFSSHMAGQSYCTK